MNIAIIVINIVVFFLMDFTGDLNDGRYLLKWGAGYAPAIVEGNQYWRLFTAAFLHGDIDHLVSNMLLLGIVGDNLERALGHIRYLLLYIVSGIGASIVSLGVQLLGEHAYITLGASGAIFGVLGALIYLLIRNKGRLEDLTLQRMIFMIGLSLYSGFTSTGIDNAAHVGGLIIGFAIAILLRNRKKDYLS